MKVSIFILFASLVLSSQVFAQEDKLDNEYIKLLNDANALCRVKDYNKALINYDKILAKYPDHGKSNFYKGFIAYTNKDYKTAVLCLEKAAKKMPDNPDASKYLNLAKSKINEGTEEGIKNLTEIEKTNANDAELAYKIGLQYEKQNNVEKALEYYKKAEALGLSHNEALKRIPFIYFEKKQFDKALEYFQKVIQREPNEHTNYLNAGLAAEKMEKRDVAIKYYEKANDMFPGDADLLYKIGLLYDEKGDKATAAKFYKDANNNGYSKKDPDAEYNLGITLMESAQYIEAIEAFNKSIERGKNVANAYFKIGFIYGKMRKFRESVNAYESAIQHDKTNYVFYYNLGLAYKDLGNFEQTIRIGEEMSRSFPTKPHGFGLMCIGYSKIGDNDNAEKYKAKAMQVDPSYTLQETIKMK